MPEFSTTKQFVIAGGQCFVAPYVSGVPSGHQRYLGNSQNLSAAVASEKIQLRSAESGLAVIDDETIVGITRTGKLTLANISLANLALFLIGSISTLTQVATPVLDEAITVNKDRWYQLGKSVANPTGVHSVGSVVVTNSAGTTTYVLNTDYQLDAVNGRIYIMPTGAITDAQALKVDYTPTAGTRDRVASSALTENTVEFWFIAANAKGANRNWYAPKCLMSPSGDAVIKAAQPAYAELGFDLTFAEPDSTFAGAALYIDGQAVA